MKKVFLKAVIAAAACLAAAGSAQAYLILTLKDVGNNAWRTCDSRVVISTTNCSGFSGIASDSSTIFPVPGLSFDSLGAAGLSFGGTIGEFAVATTFIANRPGTHVSADFNETATRVERTGAGFGETNNFFINALAGNYTLPGGLIKGFTGSAGFSSSDFAGDNPLVNTQQGLDTNNLGNFAGDGVTARATLLDATPGTGATVVGASVSNNLVFPTVDVNFASPFAPYSLTSLQTFTLRTGSTVNATSNMAVLPVSAPATLALAGLGLIGVGLAMARRRKVHG
jgi:hypothetical protein